MENEETFWAWSGHGSSASLQLSVVPSSSSDVKVIVSRSHSGDIDEVAKKGFAGKAMQIIPAGGAGYKTLETISGRASVYLHTTKIKKWDRQHVDLCVISFFLKALTFLIHCPYIKGVSIYFLADDLINFV